MVPTLTGPFDTGRLPRIAGEPVTVTVARRVEPGFEAEFLRWADDMVAAVRQAPGCLGAAVFHPGPDGGDYQIVVRFVDGLLLRQWERSPERDELMARAERFVNFQIESLLKPLLDLKNAEQVSGIARGIAFRLTESFGVLKRETVADYVQVVRDASLTPHVVDVASFASQNGFELNYALDLLRGLQVNTAFPPDPPQQIQSLRPCKLLTSVGVHKFPSADDPLRLHAPHPVGEGRA